MKEKENYQTDCRAKGSMADRTLDHITDDQRLFDLNAHLPQWAKDLVELYTSPLKYEVQSKLKTSEDYQ